MSTAFAPKEKLLFQGDRLAAFQRDDVTAPPALVEISPTNSCNAKCPWCFYVSSEYKQHHSQEQLDWDVLSRSLRDMQQLGVGVSPGLAVATHPRTTGLTRQSTRLARWV